MKIFSSYIVIALIISVACSGCVLRSRTGESFDGLGTAYDVRPLAERTAQEIRQRYSPGQTDIALDRTPGTFGDILEQALRNQGFAIGTSGVAISYTVDVLEDGAPPVGYVQVRLPEGQFLSFSRELQAPIWPTVNPKPVAPSSEPMVAEMPLPPSAPSHQPSGVTIPASPEPTASSVPTPTSPTQTPIPPIAVAPVQAESLPPFTVRTTASAAQVAKRNKVAVEDFCRWNGVGQSETLPRGYRVYLAKPASQTAVQVATPTPMKPAKVEPISSSPRVASAPQNHLMPTAGNDAIPPSAIPVAASAPISPLPVENLHEESLPPMETWSIAPGGLRTQVLGWAARAGYQLVWKAENDFLMESNANFQGDFLTAMKALFSGLQRTGGHALRVTVYQGNKVLEITEG